jgi:hypothetical protein
VTRNEYFQNQNKRFSPYYFHLLKIYDYLSWTLLNICLYSFIYVVLLIIVDFPYLYNGSIAFTKIHLFIPVIWLQLIMCCDKKYIVFYIRIPFDFSSSYFDKRKSCISYVELLDITANSETHLNICLTYETKY